MDAGDEIRGVMVKLLVGDEQSLFVMLGSDGSISRVGTGSVENVERDMFIGKASPEVFQGLRAKVTPELLGWCGRQLSDPHPQGKLCELTVGFQQAGGQELLTGWRYGSQSQGPPSEVCQFVTAAVEATNPWYEQQKAMARRG